MATCTFYIRVLLESMLHVTQVQSAGLGNSGQEMHIAWAGREHAQGASNVQQESSDESTCYRNGLGLAGACGFDFRQLIDRLVRRGRDINMSVPLRGPCVEQESLPRLRVHAHGAEGHKLGFS